MRQLAKDYYQTLGVGKSASEDDVKKAYRRLAKQFHPDVYKGDRKVAEEKFKEISEAYEVLADADKRAKYDNVGSSYAQEAFGSQGFDWNNFTRQQDVSDIFGGRSIFDVFFGGGGFGDESGDESGGFGYGSRGGRARRGRDVVVDMDISLEDAARGGEKLIRVPIGKKCEACYGAGSRSGSSGKCPACKGAGQVRLVQERGNMRMMRNSPCPQCGGRGVAEGPACVQCEGSGYVQKPTKISIKIRPGVDNGYRIRIPGGGERAKGIEAGDMFVRLNVKPHPLYERKGDDLYISATVPLLQAVTGGEISVKTIDGTTAKVTVPPGTQPHTLLRLRGKGMPRSGGSRGDMYLRVNVRIPTGLTQKQKGILKEAIGEQ